MPKNPDLLQKTYYLHKELDKELIDYISSCRNVSELIRNALIRDMRIQNGEIALIDIKNRQIIGEITLPSPTTINNDNSLEKQNTVEEESIASQEDVLSFLSTCLNNTN